MEKMIVKVIRFGTIEEEKEIGHIIYPVDADMWKICLFLAKECVQCLDVTQVDTHDSEWIGLALHNVSASDIMISR